MEAHLLLNDLRKNVVAGLPIDDMGEPRSEGRPVVRVVLGRMEPGLDIAAALVLRLAKRLVEGPPLREVGPVDRQPHVRRRLLPRLVSGDESVPVSGLHDSSNHVSDHGACLPHDEAGRSRQWLGAVPAARCMGRVSEPPATSRRIGRTDGERQRQMAPVAPQRAGATPTSIHRLAIWFRRQPSPAGRYCRDHQGSAAAMRTRRSGGRLSLPEE
jgi:hypothetical protein